MAGSDQVVPAAGARNRSIFVSYARADLDKVHQVVEGLRLLGRDVWIDESLVGGQAWWDAILARIRECDVFIQAISPAAVKSEACTSERKYAAALGKPILPVSLDALPASVLPSDLAPLQFVDYSGDAPDRRAFRLAAALEGLPAAPPLPDQPPEPPEVPMSYLVALAEKVRAPELTLDEQSAIVARLRGAAEHAEDHEGAIALLRQMRARDDLFYTVASEIDRALGEVADAQASPPPKPEPVAAPVAPAAQPSPAPMIDDQTKIEVELNKWNWGAFLLGWVWAIGNHAYTAILWAFVPFYGWYLLGKRGNRWAWEKGDWDGIEGFRKSQRKWATWAAIVDVILIFAYASVYNSSSSG